MDLSSLWLPEDAQDAQSQLVNLTYVLHTNIAVTMWT